MINVGIIGATGYTALEVARLLMQHPSAALTCATSRSETGTPLAQIHPLLAGRCDVTIEEMDADQISKRCDVVMCCLPHGASADTVRQLAAARVRVIDFSADFRLSDVATYEQWYGGPHPWPDRVGKTVYGLPEFFRDQIKSADVVANPGCYPTSAIVPLTPLVAADLIEASDIIVDSKSGTSGAGRSPRLAALYCEVNESIAAYAVGSHRHQPEIEDLVGRISGQAVDVLFTPHLVPMDRGILSTIYVKPKQAGAEAIMDCWRQTFADCRFIQVVDHLPATKHVAGTNYVQMTARVAGNRIVLVCAIDNLTKGASGAAIQNMNVMFGLDEMTGLA